MRMIWVVGRWRERKNVVPPLPTASTRTRVPKMALWSASSRDSTRPGTFVDLISLDDVSHRNAGDAPETCALVLREGSRMLREHSKYYVDALYRVAATSHERSVSFNFSRTSRLWHAGMRMGKRRRC